MASTDISKPLRTLNPGTLDAWWGPYANVAAACAAIPNETKDVDGVSINFRQGKVVGIIVSDEIIDYYWPKQYSDAGLVPVLGAYVKKDGNEITGYKIPEIQYIHPRGVAEFVGNAAYGQIGVCLFEKMLNRVIFNKIELPFTALVDSNITIRIYTSAIYSSNVSNLTLLEEVNYLPGTFNVDSAGIQTIQLTSDRIVESGNYLYVFAITNSGGVVRTRYWTSIGSNPDRHRFLYISSAASPWTSAWTISTDAFFASSFKVSFIGTTSKALIDQLALLNSVALRSDDSGNVYGAKVPEIQYQNSRGDAEITGVASFNAATYYGYGYYEKLPNKVIFNEIDTGLFGGADSQVTLRVYKNPVLPINITPSDLVLLEEKIIPSGSFSTAIGINPIKLNGTYIINANEYVFLFFYKTSGASLTFRRFTSDSEGAPFRHLFLSNQNADPALAFTNSWAKSSTSSGFYQAGIRLRYIDAVAKALNDRIATVETAYVSTDSNGELFGASIPSIQYQHIRGDAEIAGLSSFSGPTYYGLGWKYQATKKIIFNTVKLSANGYTDSVIRLRIYKSATNSNNPQVGTLVYEKLFEAGTFNKSLNAIVTISLGLNVQLAANQYLNVLLFSESGTNVRISNFSTDSGTAPARGRFMFRTNNVDPWNTSWQSSTSNLYATAMELDLIDAKIKALQDAIANVKSSDPKLLLPANMYCIKGKTLTIYYDTLAMINERVKYGSDGYKMIADCAIGYGYGEFYQVTPTVIGTYPLTLEFSIMLKN